MQCNKLIEITPAILKYIEKYLNKKKRSARKRKYAFIKLKKGFYSLNGRIDLGAVKRRRFDRIEKIFSDRIGRTRLGHVGIVKSFVVGNFKGKNL